MVNKNCILTLARSKSNETQFFTLQMYGRKCVWNWYDLLKNGANERDSSETSGKQEIY